MSKKPKTQGRSPFAARDEEIKKLRAEVEHLRSRKHIQQFAQALCESIGVILANKPYGQWPDLAKTAFRHEQERAPMAAELYRRALPRE